MFSYLLSAFTLVAPVPLFARLCTMCNKSLHWKIKGQKDFYIHVIEILILKESACQAVNLEGFSMPRCESLTSSRFMQHV
jgi:hypothetical protein